MKKAIITVSLVLLFGLGNAIANDRHPAGPEDSLLDKTRESFKNQFKNAQAVQWMTIGEYQKVSFVIADHEVEAYYNAQHELEGFGRHILTDQLPLPVLIRLDEVYRDMTGIGNILEVSNPEGVNYWLTVSTRTGSKRVEVSPLGTIMKITTKTRYKTPVNQNGNTDTAF